MSPDELDALDRALEDLDVTPVEAEIFDAPEIAAPVASADPSATRGRLRPMIERYQARIAAEVAQLKQHYKELEAQAWAGRKALTAKARRISKTKWDREAYAALIQATENRPVRQYTKTANMTQEDRAEHKRRLEREKKQRQRKKAQKAGITQHPLHGRYW